jgi:hypothetical protein
VHRENIESVSMRVLLCNWNVPVALEIYRVSQEERTILREGVP